MKIFYTFIFLFLFSTLSAFAKDSVYANGKEYTGKIETYSDGLIQIESNGVSLSFARAKKNDYYGDYITYRERPIKGGVVQTNCRILYIDRFYVVYLTENSKAQVPRYRVSSIIINVN